LGDLSTLKERKENQKEGFFAAFAIFAVQENAVTALYSDMWAITSSLLVTALTMSH